jgi:diacylglycerol kinase (ATP)
VIVGGGDGTVMWVVEEMKKYKLDFEKCPLGTIPFGTGNDFSRVLGWGGKISELAAKN